MVRGQIAFLAAWVATPIFGAESTPAAFNTHCRTCHSLKEGDNRLGPSLHMKPYKGISDQAGRKRIVDFLRSQGANP